MGTDCPFHVLGVIEGATSTEIRRAFRALAVEHHPDRGGDRSRFEEIRAAYEALRRNGSLGNPQAKSARVCNRGANPYRRWLRDLDDAARLVVEARDQPHPRRPAVADLPPRTAMQFAAILERTLAMS